MADSAKAQKLAAARKKLKEYQQKTQKPGKTEGEHNNLDALETLSNSTRSSNNGHFDPGLMETVLYYPAATSASPFHNYFSEVQEKNPEPINFFDDLSPYNQIETSNVNNNNRTEEIRGESSRIMINNDEDSRSFDDPEIKHNDIYGFYQKNLEHPAVSSEDAKKLLEYMGSDNTINVQNSLNNVEEEMMKLNVSSGPESLRQLSSQITELIKDDFTPTNSQEASGLERRNQELAAFLEEERLKTQKFSVQLRDYENRIEQLEARLEERKREYDCRLSREMGPLQEQLQLHAQTVGILVGENTELSTALTQNQILAKQKVVECEELQGRLRTSRSRVADLEQELVALKNDQYRHEQNHNHKIEMEKINSESQALKLQKDELTQDLLEIKEKLNVRTNENLSLQRELQDVTHQFSLAQVKMEQLTAGGSVQVDSKVEFLNQEKLLLEKQAVELRQALKATGEERDQANSQYQQYVQQLNAQVAQLADKLETVSGENEALSNREQNLVKHIGELERHLQNLQEEHLHRATGRSVTNEYKQAELALEVMEKEKIALEENYTRVLGEKEELLREMEHLKEVMEQLGNELERVKGNQPDSSKLLAAMESDKVAAARAVTQNSLLKQQLEEMQQAFVRMSNDKLELTENLTTEQYRSKDIQEKFNHVESQLHTLTSAIVIKDNELTHMREKLENKNKQLVQQDQLSDRLRHYEAQNGSSHALQDELQHALDEVQLLKRENVLLKENLNNFRTGRAPEVSFDNVRSEPILSESMESEITINTDVGSQTINEQIDKLDFNILDKEIAMKHLEEKFTHTMRDIANLTEEKQRLEHIVTQLQGETETIGEYIALYQHQRGVLRQRTHEKDEQLKRLEMDREKVRNKLDTLNSLVKKLVLEKGVLTAEILEHHKQLNEPSHELCTEHAKMQKEINQSAMQDEKREVTENNNVSTETAEEIISILAEIKSSNLIQPSDGLENFHPCPLCSGQLITV